MKKNKIIILIICLIGVLFTLFISSRYANNASKNSPFCAYTSNGQKIELYNYEDKYYLFVPGNEVGNIGIDIIEDNVFIDGVKLTSDYDINELSINQLHTLVFNGNTYGFKIKNTSAVSTIYITTVNGLDYVYKDKDNKETIRCDIYDNINQLNYHSSNVKIHGRGNTTWSLDKKPFVLTLDFPQSILGLNNSDKYILLANGYDESNLKNKIVYDFATQSGLAYSPSCEYVDLYIDGEYYGLYLLTEKIEISNTKLDISENSILIHESYVDRKKNADAFFTTDDGRTFFIDYCSDSYELEDVRAIFNDFEELIDTCPEGWEEKIDIESFARKYLIEEIFGNPDLASLYFYYNADDGKLYAGPAWDYDNAFFYSSYTNNVWDAKSFLANQLVKRDADKNPWYSVLYRNEEFYSAVVNIYETEYKDKLEQLINGEIDLYWATIENSSKCNSIRWQQMYDNYVVSGNAETIIDLLYERIDFLNSVWIDGTNYHTIKINRGDGSNYIYINVLGNEACNSNKTLERRGFYNDDIKLEDEDTGNIFDFNEVITTDRNLKVVSNSVSGQSNDSLLGKIKANKKAVFCLGIIGLFTLMLIFNIILDWRKQRYGNKI